MEDVNIVSVAFLVSEEYSIPHYKLKDCLDLWQNEEATSDRHQWPSTTTDCWNRHFSYTANSKYRWRKNIRIWEKDVYTAKLSRFKSFWIQSLHFRFRIQNLRRHDQTGMFSFRIRPLLCFWQNQSGTKTFRIHHVFGTISSSVNLVSFVSSNLTWRRAHVTAEWMDSNLKVNVSVLQRFRWGQIKNLDSNLHLSCLSLFTD